MSNAVADFGNAAGETELPTAHWTSYLRLEDKEKPAFFKWIRQVALAEVHIQNQPEKSDGDFAHEDIPNWGMAGIIYALAQKKAQNPGDYTKDLPLDKILEAGLPIDICGEVDRITALHQVSYATEVDNPLAEETVEILLSKGARLDARDHNGNTPLSKAASLPNTTSLIQFFIKKGAGVNNQDGEGNTPLSEAVYWQSSDKSFFETIKLLVSHPDMDWTLPGNTQKPIETLKRSIASTTDRDKELQLRAVLSLIQEPLIAHLQQQNAALTDQPSLPATAAPGVRGPSQG